MIGCDAALWWLFACCGAKYELEGVKGGACEMGADDASGLGGRDMTADPPKVELVGGTCVLVSYALAISSSTYLGSFVNKWL